jgi:ABC-2 type transport system permease protein
MVTIFLNYLSRSRGTILGWGIALALLGAYLIAFYDTILGQRDQLEQLIENYPPELMAFFGSPEDFFSVPGYIHAYFFSYMAIVIGVFAVLAGSGLLVGDEEDGKLDLILAHPISRASLFWGRVLGFGASTGLILLITYIGFIIVIPTTMMEVGAAELLLPFLSLFAFLMFFGMLAMLLSFLLPSRRLAALTSGLLLVASYFITSLSNLDESLEGAANLSPVTYLQGGNAIEGLNWAWFGGLMGLAVLFLLLAWMLFERRDIRVGGEGGWRMPKVNLSLRRQTLEE